MFTGDSYLVSVPITFLCSIVNGTLNIIREVFYIYIYIFRINCVLSSVGVCMETFTNDVKQCFNSFLPPPPFCQPVLTSITPPVDVNFTATAPPV